MTDFGEKLRQSYNFCRARDENKKEEIIVERGRASGVTVVVDYPDGRFAIRYNGVELPYRTFDKRPQVNRAAIVENKRLSPILAYIAEQQKKLDMSSAGRLGRPDRSKSERGRPRASAGRGR